MSRRPQIFLSSVFTDPEPDRLAVRDSIINLTGGMNVPAARRAIWVAEDFQELQPRDKRLSPLEKALFCVAGVRECDYFVAVLSHKPGSEIAVDGIGDVPTSFFELELTAAALYEKPSFIFLHSGFKRSERLERFLSLIKPVFPDMALQELSEREICRRVERLVKHVESPVLRHLPLRIPHKSLFVNTLFRLRHRPYRVRDEPPPIRFLDGRLDPTVGRARADIVPPLLERARGEPNFENRLILLWFAIHALMGVPYTDPTCRDYVPLWEDALGSWTSAAAWYGLHGHAAMAGLAALGSLAEARSTIAAPSDPVHGIPHGPIASAYYSIAKQVGRRDIYGLGLEHVDAALAPVPTNAADLLAIRGSIYLRLGNAEAAIADYGKVVQARKHVGGGVYGEALSELGYAHIVARHKREGLNELERGVELLMEDPRPGFSIRAMKKLAVGYARSGNPLKGLDYAIMAYDTAKKLGALDQIGRLERLAKKLEWLRRR
jgi:tetratricopeptide (TPR) repeat protein